MHAASWPRSRPRVGAGWARHAGNARAAAATAASTIASSAATTSTIGAPSNGSHTANVRGPATTRRR